MKRAVPAIAFKAVFTPFERIQRILQLRRTIKEKQLETPLNEYLDNPYSALTSTTGIYTLYSGFWVDAIKYFTTQILKFYTKDMIKSALKSNPTDSPLIKFSKNVASGGIVSGISLALIYPADKMKMDYILGIQRKEKWNLKSMYRGLGISLFGIVLYRGLYFGLYDTVRSMQSKKPSKTESFMTGLMVTLVAGLASYPLGTIQRRQMLTEEGVLEAAQNLVEKHGWISLWDGAGSNVGQGIAGTVLMMVMDSLKTKHS